MSADETITRLTLEQWALGMLEPDRTRVLEQRRHGDPELAARMDRVRAEVESAAIELPQLVLPADEPEAAGWLGWLRRPQWAVGLAAAAAALIFLLPQALPEGTAPVPDDGAIAYRGDFELRVFRVRLGEAAEQGALIDALPGDRIQYDITAQQDGYLAIYNLQDDGQLQVYLPSQPISAQRSVSEAVVLDDYAGSERIFFFIDQEPILEEQIRGAVQRAYRSPLADLDTLPGATSGQRSVLILKEDK